MHGVPLLWNSIISEVRLELEKRQNITEKEQEMEVERILEPLNNEQENQSSSLSPEFRLSRALDRNPMRHSSNQMRSVSFDLRNQKNLNILNHGFRTDRAESYTKFRRISVSK